MIGKKVHILVPAVLVTLIVLSSCAEKVCPANARQIQHMQLTKINKKRKRDKGLFPKSMTDYKARSKKKKKKEPAPSEAEVDEEL